LTVRLTPSIAIEPFSATYLRMSAGAAIRIIVLTRIFLPL
jgi:hypothetical protein